ncbi:MAG: DUF167 domain-containing protein [Candidatus Wildermuthbacteria bacterium]|nr:DUF167 domain-containing protein [Candidatus Wildermuthbacteria bacterium]
MKISVKVKPGAREEYIKEIGEGNFEVAVKEPPVQGKANRAVARALAEYFHVSQSQVSIVSGYTSRNKVVEIT